MAIVAAVVAAVDFVPEIKRIPGFNLKMHLVAFEWSVKKHFIMHDKLTKKFRNSENDSPIEWQIEAER